MRELVELLVIELGLEFELGCGRQLVRGRLGRRGNGA
jgi:hypothetical protein